jgi:Uma2 family endonuclease
VSVIILDPHEATKYRAEREAAHPESRDEVWEGVLVVPPMPNNEHQILVSRLTTTFSAVIDWDRGDVAVPGANVSDRDADWKHNYRDPDVLVYLAENPAKDSGTHWVGGPDILVEIVSPGQDPRQKLDFYAKIGTREVLVVDRYPWALELYRLAAGRLGLVGRADLANPAVLTSGVLPLTFQLRDGTPRPSILVTHTAAGQTWVA